MDESGEPIINDLRALHLIYSAIRYHESFGTSPKTRDGLLTVASRAASPAQTLATLDAITVARQRIEGNVNPALALEAMLVSAIRRPSASTPAGVR